MACLFCDITENRIIKECDLAYAIRDGFPVTKYHTLVIPKRHVADYFDLTSEEVLACNYLLKEIRNDIAALDGSVDGFNVGINCGEVAGQSIFHCHIHLIPRREGDVPVAKGGVRHLIPGKGNY